MKNVLKNTIKKAVPHLPWVIRNAFLESLVENYPDLLSAMPEQAHLRRLLDYLKVDCVLDVGANAVQYADVLRKKANYTGRIISFEPIPHLATEMRKRATKDELWHVEEIALADHDGYDQFTVMVNSQFSSLSAPKHDEVAIFNSVNTPDHKIKVRTETLQSAFTKLKSKFDFKRPFLKLDTQGLDVNIIRSGSHIIHNFVGIQSELAIKKIYDESVDFRKALYYYNKIGFELSAFVPNNSGHFPLLIEMDCILVRRDLLSSQ